MPNKETPTEAAARDNYAYVGESGARETKKSALWNKTPEDAERYNLKETRQLAQRAAYIANDRRRSRRR